MKPFLLILVFLFVLHPPSIMGSDIPNRPTVLFGFFTLAEYYGLGSTMDPENQIL